MLRKSGLMLAAVSLFVALIGTGSAAFAASDRLPTYARSGQMGAAAGQVDPSAMMPMVAATGSSQEYVLGVGDRVKLTVYGEADLSGDYEVGSTGMISLPLIGDVPAAGQSASMFEQMVKQRLTQGYLRDPRVSAQVVNYRPFFILGEVSKPGSYPYVNGMTVVNAVALAGGYTYRADRKSITIKRASDPEHKDRDISEADTVMPGDVLHVPERFF